MPDTVPLRTRVAVGGALIGSFMAILNIQVVNTSLPDIQGGIGTGLDNGGWISTAYLVGEITVIPLSGWLSEVFSLRRYLIGSTFLFLLFSVACGLATNFPEMVTLRAIQGSGPATTVLGASTIGGAITDLYGWRYIFFLNLVPGAVMLAALIWGLAPAPMQLKKFARGDWVGIFTMALGLGTLQVVLEEGNKDDWFGSPFILRLSIISVLSLGAFLFQELRPGNKAPLVNLRLFARRNFGVASIANTLLGFVLYGSVYLIPIYLAEAHGYSARQTGIVMAWIGLPQLLIIPCMPYLMRRFDSRWLLLSGFVLFAISSLMNIHLGPDESGPQLLIPNLIRAVGQALVFPPMSQIVTAGIPFKDAGSASSLFNMLRNLGGAIGIAVVQTFVTNREKFHSTIIMPRLSLLNPATQQRLRLLQHYFATRGLADPQGARHAAIIAMGRTVQAQSFFLAYGDAFALLGAMMVIASVVVLFLHKPSGSAAPGAH